MVLFYEGIRLFFVGLYEGPLLFVNPQILSPEALRPLRLKVFDGFWVLKGSSGFNPEASSRFATTGPRP